MTVAIGRIGCDCPREVRSGREAVFLNLYWIFPRCTSIGGYGLTLTCPAGDIFLPAIDGKKKFRLKTAGCDVFILCLVFRGSRGR